MEDTLNKNEYTIVDTLPDCDTNSHPLGTPPHFKPETARYDGATKPTRRWAYMCEEHFTAVGVGLGLGIGQKLILRDSDEHKAIQAEKAQQPKPDVESLLRAAVMGDTVETSDGCEVEADGKCPHGLLSPLRELGLI
jgi:hypothetical protein